MLAAYGTLYDSMMAYFRKGYADPTYQRKAAANALSLMIVFNFVSIANLLDITGITSMDVRADSVLFAIALYVGLVIGNRRFAHWRGSISEGPYAESVSVSRAYATIYIIVSFAALVASFVLLALFG